MSTIKCPQCNLVNWVSEFCCKRCGFALQPLDASEQPSASADTFSEAPPGEFVTEETPMGIAATQPFGASQPGRATRSEPAYRRNYQPDAAKQRVGLALFSMICGIIAMPPISTIGGAVVGGILFAIGLGMPGMIAGIAVVFSTMPAGVISGIVALRRSNRSPREFGGRGMAIGGIVCSSLAIVVIPLIAAIAIPNLLAARRSANEASALSTIRTLAKAEESILKAGQYTDLKGLISSGLADPSLDKGEKNGYKYMIVASPGGTCEIHAMPMSASLGNRSFYYSTSDGMIRAAEKKGMPADKNDPTLSDPYDDAPPKIASQKRR